MRRKLTLPLTLGGDARPPTVDTVRKRLGGRASTDAGAGDLVGFRSDAGADRVGVVLFVRGDELDVWIEGGVVRRLRRTATRAVDAAVPSDLAAISAAGRAFADLREGQRVRFEQEGRPGEGTLVEKCRFGGLVERADGAVVGVGFRRLSAADDCGDRN